MSFKNIISMGIVSICFWSTFAFAYDYQVDISLLRWIRGNVSPQTNMPLSFYINSENKKDVFSSMGAADDIPGIIERVITEEGLVIYDGAVGQIVLTLTGEERDLKLARIPVTNYWNGHLGELANIRAGYLGQTFIYDPKNPEAVSADLSDYGKRGFIFRILNAHGKYNTADPLDGKTYQEGFPTWPTIHWEDWKPVAGENAWVVMAALHIYHRLYYDQTRGEYFHNFDAPELKLAQELARAAMLLQAEVGGIRMAPIGTFREGEQDSSGMWWYNQISSENNISWYSVFRMLYDMTGNEEYKVAMEKIEQYFREAWNAKENCFYQGMTFENKSWHFNTENFALDVQTWGILSLGPQKIDEWFGEGASYRLWQVAKERSGVWDEKRQLMGVGYTDEHDRISVEWTDGAIMAAREIARYYSGTYREWSEELMNDARQMRVGIELLRSYLTQDRSAYSYSSKRGWILFGWNSHDPRVLSLASTGWMVFVDNEFNPFYLGNKQSKSK